MQVTEKGLALLALGSVDGVISKALFRARLISVLAILLVTGSVIALLTVSSFWPELVVWIQWALVGVLALQLSLVTYMAWNSYLVLIERRDTPP